MGGTVSDSTDYAPRRELKGTKSGVEYSAFASNVVVKQQPALSPVRIAGKGSESCAWSDTPYSVVSVRN